MNLKTYFKKIIVIKKSPHSIALGFAVGTFIAILPTLGFAPLIGLLILLIFTKLNKFSLFGSFIIWNPLVLLPFYYIGYNIGNLFFGKLSTINFEFSLLNAIHFLSLRFLIGMTILASLIAILSYFIVKYIVIKFQNKQ